MYRRYDLALDSADFRVTREEEEMFGIADKLGVAGTRDYGMSEAKTHGLIFTKTGKQVDPGFAEEAKVKRQQKGELSANLRRMFGTKAVAKLDFDEVKNKLLGDGGYVCLCDMWADPHRAACGVLSATAASMGT